MQNHCDRSECRCQLSENCTLLLWELDCVGDHANMLAAVSAGCDWSNARLQTSGKPVCSRTLPEILLISVVAVVQ